MFYFIPRQKSVITCVCHHCTAQISCVCSTPKSSGQNLSKLLAHMLEPMSGPHSIFRIWQFHIPFTVTSGPRLSCSFADCLSVSILLSTRLLAGVTQIEAIRPVGTLGEYYKVYQKLGKQILISGFYGSKLNFLLQQMGQTNVHRKKYEMRKYRNKASAVKV